MSADTEPRRLTPTERLHEVTMAAMGRKPAEPESSVTITRNAKGVVQFEVTIRHTDPVQADAIARNFFASLERAYPYPNGDGE